MKKLFFGLIWFFFFTITTFSSGVFITCFVEVSRNPDLTREEISAAGMVFIENYGSSLLFLIFMFCMYATYAGRLPGTK